MTSPCKGCDDRQVGCHASCAAYLAWSADRREQTKKETNSRLMANYVEMSHAASVKRTTSGYEARRRHRMKKNRDGRR